MNAPANKAEGWALLEMARRLERVRVSDPDSIKDAVRLNWRIWTIIQAAMLDPQTEIPITVRSNLINLTNFIDKRSVELISKPLPDKLDVLVNINRQIGAGLMGSPSDADDMEDEDEADESDASDVSLDEGDAAVGQPAAGQSADGPVIYSRRGGGGGVAGQPTPNEADLSVIAPSAGPAGGAQIHASAAGSETEETESAPPASAMPIPEKNRQIADLLAAPRATDSPRIKALRKCQSRRNLANPQFRRMWHRPPRKFHPHKPPLRPHSSHLLTRRNRGLFVPSEQKPCGLFSPAAPPKNPDSIDWSSSHVFLISICQNALYQNAL